MPLLSQQFGITFYLTPAYFCKIQITQIPLHRQRAPHRQYRATIYIKGKMYSDATWSLVTLSHPRLCKHAFLNKAFCVFQFQTKNSCTELRSDLFLIECRLNMGMTSRCLCLFRAPHYGFDTIYFKKTFRPDYRVEMALRDDIILLVHR